MDGAEPEARFRIEPLDLGHHLDQLLGIDANGAAQRCEVVAAEQRQIVEQPGDLRIVAIEVFQLQRQALREVASKYAGRIEALQSGEHLGYERLGCAELHGQIVGTALQVAGLVHHVDEMHADEPLGRVRHHQVQLLG